MNSQTSNGAVSSSNAKPNVIACNPGYIWDSYLGKCVPQCPNGYHNDSLSGACVLNAPTYISFAGVRIGYYVGNHTLSFSSVADVNTVLNQLDTNYETYNTNYTNLYPNATDLQLDSLDSVNNFDPETTYENFENQFSGFTSERSVFYNNETTWLNNNMTGSDPDSLDYTLDNSENAISNSSYEFMIAGYTYQWTATGLSGGAGGPQTAISNTPTGSCFSNYKGISPQWFHSNDYTRKCRLKVAVNDCILRGEAKVKVTSYRIKSNGRKIRSRLAMSSTLLGPLLFSGNCSLYQNVDKIDPAQGYTKTVELKNLQRVPGSDAYIYSNTFTGSFTSDVSGLSGSITL